MKLEIRLDTPGTLSKKIPLCLGLQLTSLKITGFLNRQDFDDVLDAICSSMGEYDDDDNYILYLDESPSLRCLDMGEAIFEDGEELPFFGYHTQLESLILPSGISSVLDNGETDTGFSGSEMLKKLVLPNGIKILGGLHDCPNLKEVKLPESVECIESYTFAGCTSIEEIRIPKNVSCFDGSSFADCHISRFELDSDNPNFKEIDGVIYSKDLSRLVAFPSYYPHANFAIPPTTRIIGWGAFMDSRIDSIEIPESVEEIEEEAFQGSEIKSITIPDSVKKIGKGAFRFCRNLESIKLSGSISKIPEQLFSSCHSLKKIDIPPNIKKIEYTALAWCDGLEEIIFHSGVEEVIPLGPLLIRTSHLKRVVIPDTLKSLPGGAFSYSGNPDVFELDSRNPYFSLRDGILYSKDGSRIISVPNRNRVRFDVPAGVTVISEMVFLYMVNLAEVTLPDTLKAIESRAFQGCNSLRSITIPASVTQVDIDALWADNIEDVYLGCSIPPTMTGPISQKDWRYSNVRLHVPRESVTSYRNSPGWQCFDITPL